MELDLTKVFNAEYEEAQEGELLPATRPMTLESVRPQLLMVVREVDRMVADAHAIEVVDPDAEKFAVSLGGQAKGIAKIIKAKEEELTRDAREYVRAVGGFCDMFLDKLVANTKKTNQDSIELVLKKKVGDYQSVLELRRREQEAAARKAQQELQARLDREAEEANRKIREEAMRKAEEEMRIRRAREAEERARIEEKESKAKAEARAKREAEEMEAAKRKAEEEAKSREVIAPIVPDIAIPKSESVVRTESGAASFQAKRWVCEIVDESLIPRSYCSPDQKKLNEAVKAGIRNIEGCSIREVTETRFRS